MPTSARWAGLEVALDTNLPAGTAVGIDNFTIIRTLLNDDIADEGINDQHVVGLNGVKIWGNTITDAAGSEQDAGGVTVSNTSQTSYGLGQCFVGAKDSAEVIVGCTLELANETTSGARAEVNVLCQRRVNGGSASTVWAWWHTLPAFAARFSAGFTAYDEVSLNEGDHSIQYLWYVAKRGSVANNPALYRSTTFAISRWR
jgi:hypothetical protein